METTASEMIRCQHCGSKNRIPAGHLRETARCGKCHQILPTEAQDKGPASVIMRCGECLTKNRLASSQLGDEAKCGKCGAPLRVNELHAPQPITISDQNFQEKVLKSPLPVLLFAMSPSCPTCSVAAPQVEAFARESRGKIRVGKLNIQFNPRLASRFNIMSVPYLLIFDKGQLLEELPGALDKHQLLMKMTKYLY